MSGAIDGGLLVVIASFAFLLVRHARHGAGNRIQQHDVALQGVLLMMCLQLGMLGAAMVLYAWALHGVTALATGLAIGAPGAVAARIVHQRWTTPRRRLSPRTQPSG